MNVPIVLSFVPGLFPLQTQQIKDVPGELRRRPQEEIANGS